MKSVSNLLRRTRSLLLLVPGLLGAWGLVAQAAGPEPAGWYAGDMHVHRSCGTSPVTVSSIYNTMVSQDLAVISLLADMGNGEVQNATTDLPWSMEKMPPFRPREGLCTGIRSGIGMQPIFNTPTRPWAGTSWRLD